MPTLRYSKASEKGFTLVEVLISAGILGMVALALSTLTMNLTKEQKALSEKFSLLELKSNLLSTLANGEACLALLNQGSPILDLSSATTTNEASVEVAYSELRLGPLPTSPLLAAKGEALPGYTGNQMVVKDIKLTKIFSTGVPNLFTGSLEIWMDQDTVTRSFKPVSTNLLFAALPNPTPATSIIASCSTPSTSPSGTLCGSSFNIGVPVSSYTSDIVSMFTKYTSLCQGIDPAAGCPPGYTQKEHMFWFKTCVKD